MIHFAKVNFIPEKKWVRFRECEALRQLIEYEIIPAHVIIR